MKTALLCVVAYLAGAYAGNVALQLWNHYQTQTGPSP